MKKNTTKLLGVMALVLSSIGPNSAAHAVSFEKDGFKLDINGTVNGFFVNREETTFNTAGVGTEVRNSGISNGLLPGWINFVGTTTADGNDIKVHFGFAPGINDNSQVVGLPIGSNTSGGSNAFAQLDTRNVYFQIGNATWGTVKFGRDIGLFGQDIILSDMTLLGVGGTPGAAQPFNTTFGMISTGYMYAGFQPQITYASPKLGPATVSAGLFQPKNFQSTNNESPALQAKLDLDLAPARLWASLINQRTDGPNGVTSTGFELGAKVGVGAAEFVAYGFSGEGIGLSTVGALFLAPVGTGPRAAEKTDSQGYFLQGTYKLTDKTKVGLNFGQNKDEKGGAGPDELKKTGYTLGVYHSLNKFITLVGEFNKQELEVNGALRSTASNGASENQSISLGAILFF